MQQWIKEVARGKRGSRDLTYAETRKAARLIIEGKATDAQIAAYFVSQRLKTESADELLAFIHTFQERTEKLDLQESVSEKLIDFAGPYTGRNSFAATIPSSILLAANNMPSFLHGTDSLPPKYGVSLREILEELGIETDHGNESLSRIVGSSKIGFAKTDRFCSPLVMLRSIREEVGVRTLMNTVEKLLDLSSAHSLMMGAFHRTAIIKIAPVFKGLPFKRVYIVQGVEGSEDLPVYRNSFIYTIKDGILDSFIVNPDDYGLFEELPGKDKLTSEEQAGIINALLSGERSGNLRYYYKQLLFNTGVRYYLFEAAPTILEGINIAKEQLQTQKGLQQLQRWKQNSKSIPTNS
ncbi:anthranilate phosphoribosyltransferase [Pseudalkalibacillus sp. A8]|uniref:anthranilate phosphoribosyltransferase n=1 Tax=Pseudalkalibacillus sp. A8 TaxID=3382641 RepID=UPI0038B4F7D4